MNKNTSICVSRATHELIVAHRKYLKLQNPGLGVRKNLNANAIIYAALKNANNVLVIE